MKKKITEYITNIYYTCQWRWYYTYRRIVNWFRPRNRWATSIIPNHYSDKSYLIPEFLFAAIVDFVEAEKALEYNTWKAKDRKAITEVYEWAKTGRQEFQKRIDAAYPSSDSLSFIRQYIKSEQSERIYDISAISAYTRAYEQVSKLEDEMKKTNMKHMLWIVRHHDILWT